MVPYTQATHVGREESTDMTWFEQLLTGASPALVLVVVGVMVMIESFGIPVPGETTIIAASLLSASQLIAVPPLAIAIVASAGAIVGDSVGYWVFRIHGDGLVRALHQRSPRQLNAVQIAWASSVFDRYGSVAVFFGRFIALLRMLSGPLSGFLRMPYPRFLLANSLGAVAWSFTVTYVIYGLGVAAEAWLSDLGWILLVLIVVLAVVLGKLFHRRMEALTTAFAVDHPDEVRQAQQRLLGDRDPAERGGDDDSGGASRVEQR